MLTLKDIPEELFQTSIILTGMAFYEPNGYFYCSGRLLDIAEFPYLYKKLGNKYGGDGVTKFGLPDLTEAEKDFNGARFIISAYADMDDYLFTSSILPTNDPEAPADWMFCEGQILDINPYPGIYSVMGITFGGDGYTRFALPDLREAGKKYGVRYMIYLKGIYPARW